MTADSQVNMYTWERSGVCESPILAKPAPAPDAG